jgi:purine nucleoside phosphorylase
VAGKIVKVTHQDVIQAAMNAEPKMTRIIKEMISRI